MNAASIAKHFERVLPLERILTDAAVLREYGRDTTEIPEGRPDVVLKLETDEEALAVVKVAASERIPIIPRIAGTNLGGLSLAPKGGAILDLTGMNRIVDVNPVDMLAVIEPGVTFGQLVDHLEKNHPELTIGIPLSPPNTSVMANCLLDGLGNLSLIHGTMGQWITGLEVILASGETIRTGAWAVSDIPFSRSPLPDLTGLFVSWQGSTGLVTRMAVELKPKLPFRERLFVLTYNRRSTYVLMRLLARLKLFDDIGGLSWPTGKMLFGVAEPKTRDPSEPEFFTYIDVSASAEDELDIKLAALDRSIESVRKSESSEIEDPLSIETLCAVAPEFQQFTKFPTDLTFLTENIGGGLTWIGTYGPMSRFEPAADLGIEIMERHGFPPIIVSRPMKGGHFGVLRFITTFDRADPAVVEKVRESNRELADMVVEQGFVPYKTPLWSVDKLLPRMYPGTHDLMKKIRTLLDPDGIMNPGGWRLDPHRTKDD